MDPISLQRHVLAVLGAWPRSALVFTLRAVARRCTCALQPPDLQWHNTSWLLVLMWIAAQEHSNRLRCTSHRAREM